MTRMTLTTAVTAAARRLTEDTDVSGHILRLVTDCADVMQADAVGVLAAGPHDTLDIVGATSSTMVQLELFEIQQDQGPCMEAIGTAEVVTASDDELTDRWNKAGGAMLDAGFHSVHAFPLLWHQRAVGALNVFHRAPTALNVELRHAGEAFATLAALVLARPNDLDTTQLHQHVLDVLESRTVIQQAKGVIADQNQISVEVAFDLLVDAARVHQRPLVTEAADIVSRAYRVNPHA